MIESHHDAAPRTVVSEGLSLTLYRGSRGLGELREAWGRLADGMTHKRYIHLHPWYRSYLESIEPHPEEVLFVLIARGDVPLAVFPLMRSVRKVCGLSFRCLEVPSNPHLNLGDFVFDKTADSAVLVRVMVRNIRRLTGQAWDLIHVPNAPEDSAVGYALQQAPVPFSLSVPNGRSNHVDCSPPYEQVEEKFKGTFRRNLRRLRRRAEGQGELRYASYSTVEDLARHFPEFLRVETAGWKGSQGTQSAIACDPSTTAFYRMLVEEFGADGRCWLNLLALGGKYIAGQLCLLVGGTLYILKIGYDEAHADIAPGNLIMGETIRQCAEDSRVLTVSFVTGKEWNFLWGADSTTLYIHNIFNRATLRGWLGYFTCLAKNRLMPLLPGSIRDRVTTARGEAPESNGRSAENS